jgi:hypothetical protein
VGVLLEKLFGDFTRIAGEENPSRIISFLVMENMGFEKICKNYTPGKYGVLDYYMFPTIITCSQRLLHVPNEYTIGVHTG